MPKTTLYGWGSAGTNALDPDGVKWPGKPGVSRSPVQTTARRSKKTGKGSSAASSAAGVTEVDE